jgi:hypothetical protein
MAAKRPIVTYEGQGVAKPGVNKGLHSIAYISSDEPRPQETEQPRYVELPMLPGIRIIPKKRRAKLDKMSRIDFSRMYIVEHNVKVFDFGQVAHSHLGRLQSQWMSVIFPNDGGTEGGNDLLRLGEQESWGRTDEDDGEDEEEEENEEDQGADSYRGDFTPKS